MKTMKQQGVWLEVTTLVIPELNDDPKELQDAAQFIAQELGPETPWHISRFFPNYQMGDRPPTPIATMQQARQIGLQAGLHYVYLGNVTGESNTECPGCGRILIRRRGYWDIQNFLLEGHCPDCGMDIAGVW